jgi:adenylate kinase
MSNVYILMGPQGAGKGTQAQMLAEQLGAPTVATGDILRDISKTETPLGRLVNNVLRSGQLVSDDILAEVVSDRLSGKDCQQGCILDGFPRTIPQARLLERIAQGQGHRIVAINIDVPREDLLHRLSGRRMCPACGAIYHVDFKPPKSDNACDVDGSPLVTRTDDNEEAIRQRLSLYDEKTRPLLDYYDESNRLHVVDGTGTPEEVFDRILEVVRTESVSANELKKSNSDD